MSSSLSICRTLNLREKSFPVPRSSETATAWSVAAIGLVSLRKIFLPTKFSYPKFRGSGPRSSTRSIPTARPGPARLSSTAFRLIKPPIEGRKIVWVGIFPKPPAGGTRIRQSFRLKAGLRTRKSQSPKNFPTNKIFLPQIPRLGAGVFHPFNAHRPARPGPAQPFSRLIKPPVAGRKILGSSLLPMGEQTKPILSFGGIDRSWASSRDESLRERLRLIVSTRGFLGPAHRRQVIAVCDQQTPAPYTGDDQSEGCSNVSPLGETY